MSFQVRSMLPKRPCLLLLVFLLAVPVFAQATKRFQAKPRVIVLGVNGHGTGHHSPAAAEGPDAEFVEGDREGSIRK